jgi:hypothetical protein
VRIAAAGRCNPQRSTGVAEMEPVRISPSETYRPATEGSALVVCAYPDEETCSKMRLPGSITRTQFQVKLPEIAKGQEILFYCA